MNDGSGGDPEPNGVRDIRKVDRALLELLVCPVRRTTLIFDVDRHELISAAADLAYPISSSHHVPRERSNLG